MFSVDGAVRNVTCDDSDDDDVHRRHGYATPEAAPKTCHPLQLLLHSLFVCTNKIFSFQMHIHFPSCSQAFDLKFWTIHTVYPHHDNHEIEQEKIEEELISNLLPTCL